MSRVQGLGFSVYGLGFGAEGTWSLRKWVANMDSSGCHMTFVGL